jgi:hypothetical protein
MISKREAQGTKPLYFLSVTDIEIQKVLSGSSTKTIPGLQR